MASLAVTVMVPYSMSQREVTLSTILSAASAALTQPWKQRWTPVNFTLILFRIAITCSFRFDMARTRSSISTFYALAHRKRLADHLICVAPLVVVPAHDLDQTPADDLGKLKIDDGRLWITYDVRRNKRVT